MANATIPVIDLSDPTLPEETIARNLVDAFVDHGFAYVRNTGEIPAEQMDKAFEICRTIFTAPREEMERCKIQKNNRGWSGMHSETLDPKMQKRGDYKEAFNFGAFVDGKPQQPVPSSVTGLEDDISAWWDACHELTLKILRLLGIGLGVDPPTFFHSAHLPEKGPSGTTLRFLHYPVLDDTDGDDTAIRAGAHSDYGSITLLFRLKGQPGLELQSAPQTFHPVPVSPPQSLSDPTPPILVNIGDLLSYWTNGLFRSTVHRVVFPKAGGGVDGEDDPEPRYSIAFFCHPVGSAPLDPVPSERVRTFRGGVDGGNEYAERRVLTADEHLVMRLRSSYLDLYADEDKS